MSDGTVGRQVSSFPWLGRLDGSRAFGTGTLLTFALIVTYSLLWSIGQNHTFQKGDFGAYYRAGKAVAAGKTPYFVDENGPTETFVYAPAYAFLFQPLSGFEFHTAARMWMVINWLLAILCVCLGLELVVDGWRQRAPWLVIWLALVPTANFFWANIRSGQVGILMLVCCLGWAVCARRGKSFGGGMLLAAGCALKLAPGVLLPYLIVRRDFRGLAGVLAGSLILFALPALWVGWEGTVRLHQEWPQHCRATQIPAQTCHPINQSLLGLLARLPWVSDGGSGVCAENLSLLERSYALVLLVLVGGAYTWIWQSRRQTRLAPDAERGRDNTHLALLLLLMTMAHVRAWVFNYVGLFPACLILADRIVRWLPGWRVALAALVSILLIAPICWPDPYTTPWSISAWLMQGKFFWNGLAVAAACWWCSRVALSDMSLSDTLPT
jgi:hypothetical protein